jgi:hypothetical protein
MRSIDVLVSVREFANALVEKAQIILYASALPDMSRLLKVKARSCVLDQSKIAIVLSSLSFR